MVDWLIASQVIISLVVTIRTLLLSTILLFTVNLNAQDVNVPDSNFKSYLVNNTAINTNSDGEIQVSEANAFTGTINCSNLSISDLTGIEAFTALTGLSCGSNQLTSLDVSGATALVTLNCAFNQLTSLDVSNNNALIEIDCEDNQLTSLDVSNNNALTILSCGNNLLTSLDISSCNALTGLFCFDNEQLQCLNLKNGNNTVMSLYLFDNPNLTCIEVDDENYSTTNWTGANIDSQIYFSTGCNGCFCIPTSSIITAEGLDSYTAPSGDVYITGGVYTDTIPNAAGCDSIITIDLSLNYTGIGELNTTPKQLIKIVDVLGRETPFKPNTPLLYIYNDGTVERKMVLK